METKAQGNTNEETASNNDENNSISKTPVKNPFDGSSSKELTQEDIENEQKYKEAMSERD